MDGRLDRWDAGTNLNDDGWAAGPGFTETYCPQHATDELRTPNGTNSFARLFQNPPSRKARS